MKFQAHKGVSTEHPENTMPAYRAAVQQGYDIIELDVSVTKDMQFVMLHDATINRTGRYKDGSSLKEEILISELTYKEASEYDYGLWFSEDFKGTKLPLFKEVLEFAKETGISLKIDNKYQKYTEEQRRAFYQLLQPYQDVAWITCNQVDFIKEAKEALPNIKFHYDGVISEEILEEVAELVPTENLIVWVPYQNRFTKWFKGDFVDEELAALIRKYAKLGIWLISEKEELEYAEKLGAEVVETNGHLKPM